MLSCTLLKYNLAQLSLHYSFIGKVTTIKAQYWIWMWKGGPGASGRVLPPVTGRSRVRVVVSSHCTGEGKACHWHPSLDPAQSSAGALCTGYAPLLNLNAGIVAMCLLCNGTCLFNFSTSMDTLLLCILCHFVDLNLGYWQISTMCTSFLCSSGWYDQRLNKKSW